MNPEHILIEIKADTQGLNDTLSLLEKLGKIDKRTADDFRAATKAYTERNKALGDISKYIDNVNKKKPIEVVKRDQIGIIENLKNRINQLTEARDKANDPAKIVRYNALLQSQNQRLRELQGTAVSTTRGVGVLDSAISGIGSAIAGAFAVQSVIRFADEAVKAFQEAERNALLLRSAVSVNGGLQADFEDLIRQSQTLQRITIFSDDSIQNAQTAALQFGLTKDQVKALIPVVANFASATGQDLRTALDGVLQGVNGMGRGLKIYGVTIDETQTATERLGDISDQLTKKFEGQAEAIGNTATGAAAKYANQIDDLKEKLGKDLAPALQNLQLILLQTSDAFVKASSGPSSFAVELGKIFAGNTFIGQFDKLKNSFKEKLETKSVEELKKLYQELSVEQAKLSGTARTEALAKQAAALDLLKEKTQQSTKATKEEVDALEKLKDASNLSNEELLKIKKTLESFNNINLRDEIALIDEIIEKRKKATGKTLSERQAALQKLHELEQKASDDNVSIKAAEVNKVIELEQKKQQAIRDLVVNAGKASGADVEPILIEFETTGRVDLEKTLQLLKDAKFPTDEIEKFTKAVDDTTDSFKRLQAAILNAKNIDSLKNQFKDAFDFIEEQAGEASAELDKTFTDRKIKLITEFETTGGDSSSFAALMNEFDKLDRERNAKILHNAIDSKESQLRVAEDKIEQSARLGEKENKELTDAATKLNNEITALKQTQNEQILNDTLDRVDAEIQAEEEKRDRIIAISTQIAQYASDFISKAGQAINDYYQGQIDQIDAVTRKQLEAYDEESDALERKHEKNQIGDRQYESQREALANKRKNAEKQADIEIRKLKREQAQYNKAIALAEAVINTAVAVTANLSVPIVAAAIAILGAAEIAVIAAEPIPAFAKGVEKIDGKGTETSDSIPVRLSKGERVVTAEKNRKYFPILSAIHHGKVKPEMVNALADPKILRSLETQTIFKDFTELRPRIVELHSSKEKTETTKYVGLTEGDMMWINKQGVNIKDESLDVLADKIGKRIAKALHDPYAHHRK